MIIITWSKQEVKTLKRLYPKKGSFIESLDRSRPSILNKANRFGLEKESNRSYKTLECEYCGKEFKMPESEYKHKSRTRDNFYCSRKCFKADKRKTISCKYCGKNFSVEQSKDRKFCSMECYGNWMSENITGKAHPKWTGGEPPSKKILHDDRWKKMREKVYERDDFECQLCGEKGKLNAHHIKPKRKMKDDDGNYTDEVFDITNVITLCKDCHMKLHRGELNEI